MERIPIAGLFVSATLIAGCAGETNGRRVSSAPIAHSVRERPARPVVMDAEKRAERERAVEAAARAADAEPSEENIIWHGRRLGYAGRYADAIDVYTRGLERYPGSYRLLRHRGHRHITLHEFDDALADLERARRLAEGEPDAIEPDGEPNPTNVARSTDKSNIYYHLGLAYYLRGEFANADRVFAMREGLAAYNDDMLVSTTHWRYLALRRLGRDAEAEKLLAPIREGMDVLENTGYYTLCKVYKGIVAGDALIPPPSVEIKESAVAYGLARWLYLGGRPRQGRDLLERVDASASWASFGAIAASADLARENPVTFVRGED